MDCRPNSDSRMTEMITGRRLVMSPSSLDFWRRSRSRASRPLGTFPSVVAKIIVLYSENGNPVVDISCREEPLDMIISQTGKKVSALGVKISLTDSV